MRIGYDAKRLFSNMTGLGNYSRTLVSNYHSYYPENQICLFAPKIIENSRTQTFLNTPYELIIPNGIEKIGWRSYGMVKSFKRKKIDLYHGLSHELPIGIRGSDVPSVVTMHDLIYKYFPEDFPLLDRWVYELKFKFAVEQSTRIIAISEATKSDLINIFDVSPDKIDVLYQTISPVFMQEPDNEYSVSVLNKYNIGQEFILNVGSIIRRKNLEVLIEAYHNLPINDRPQLVIAGNGGMYEKKIDGLIQSFGLTNSVIKIPNPTLEELNVLYHKALLSVYPSLMEGFGLPVLESITAGTPVITTELSSLPEAGGQAAIYFDGKNIEQLSESIVRELSNPIKGSSDFMANRSGHLKKFDAGKLSESLNQIYKSICQ